MYFLRFYATPRTNAAVAPDAAGGSVACWIERPTLVEAIRVARLGIQAHGWIVNDPEEAYVVGASTYPMGNSGRRYFQQALIDKEVLVFFTYPLEARSPDGEQPGNALDGPEQRC